MEIFLFIKNCINKKFFFWSVLFILALHACSKHWTQTLSYGAIENEQFDSSIAITIKNGLLIVPVTINNEEYNFLFDTGAPLSISKELQDKFNFKTINQGFIKDTDNNRTQVDYVSVQLLTLNTIHFTNQTAFVGDFTKNPIIACLQIDGIIGSNLIRHCNWKIDTRNQKIQLSNTPFLLNPNQPTLVPFNTNKQYNLKFNAHIGSAKISNLILDYGSNSGLTLSNRVFDTLKKHHLIEKSFRENGVSSTGILGKKENLNREISYVNGIKMGDLVLDTTYVKSGNSGLLGTQVLSKYEVAINWSTRTIEFREYEPSVAISFETFGFKIGVAKDEHLYIQSIIEHSPAAKAGIQLNMPVLKMDTLDFSKHNFCDYMRYVDANPKKEVILELKDTDGKTATFNVAKSKLK